MNELEELKARAKEEREALMPLNNDSTGRNKRQHRLVNYLDRAIAIAEKHQNLLTLLDTQAKDLAECAEKLEKVENYASYTRDIEAQRDEAVAAAKALREARCLHQEFVENCPACRTLADTAWLES